MKTILSQNTASKAARPSAESVELLKNKNLDYFEQSEKAIVAWIKEPERKGEEK